jgi:protein Cut8
MGRRRYSRTLGSGLYGNNTANTHHPRFIHPRHCTCLTATAVFIVTNAPAAYPVLRLRASASMNAIDNNWTPPHLLPNRLSPTRNSTPHRNPQPFMHSAAADQNPSTVYSPYSSTMSGRKRKATDDESSDDRMSASPGTTNAELPRQPPRHTKRMRSNISGRPLALPRLLETLSADEMRRLLQSICQRHPDIGNEVVSTAPRPSISSTLEVLSKYETAFQAAFPFGGRSLKDFTPHFLPPHEQQPATSLAFLDGATEVIHRLPNWDTYQHNRHKEEAYEEMAKAWAIVIREAAKKAGGMQLLYGGWDQKIVKHNEASGGKMQEAVNELRGSIGWMDADTSGPPASGPADAMSIRQQLLSGNYGMGASAGIGAW